MSRWEERIFACFTAARSREAAPALCSHAEWAESPRGGTRQTGSCKAIRLGEKAGSACEAKIVHVTL